jgi:hypothetical protein
MPGLLDEARGWSPTSSNQWRTYLGRALSVPSYPTLLPFAVLSHCDATAENALWWRNCFSILGIGMGTFLHTWVWKKYGSDRSAWWNTLAHSTVFFMCDHVFLWMTYFSKSLKAVFEVNRKTNRLNAGKLEGPRICIVGNGPSALSGEPLGHMVDQFDEVVRFNNFQNKIAGMEKWVGSKTTVHFSDGVLYPTYSEYHVPGASVVLTLFADRFMVAGSYVALRGGCDLQTQLTLQFLKDPTTTWLEKEQIDSLKKKLGLVSLKHPTSGMLAIDYFINKPGVELPVTIFGFDFFQGPKMHYFDDHEPLYERINDRIGVNQHSPLKEKAYVEKLVAEGKVRFLAPPGPAAH